MRHRLPFLAALVPLALYPFLRRPILTWRDTKEEAARRLPVRLGMLPMEPASLVMERKMLRGIKQRAEHLATAPRSST